MVSYTDVAKFASEAYLNALLSNAEDAKSAAVKAAEELGLGEHMAEVIADEIARIHLNSAQRSAEAFS
ncbi:MAG: hypothetical protein OXQ96_05545 [Alphaproteobacteria bacterium]|nr:hypothetical protein [Alphaproteobacteria bacterium]